MRAGRDVCAQAGMFAHLCSRRAGDVASSLSLQVSRPLPLPSDQGQTPWLLSLRGELVASLEDASLMGLYVDINATTVTVQSPRQDLLQRWEVSDGL
ncbi:hypothetical protein P7K49_015425 [Saguinus oedipus]|uniref:Uncharacterized protein n=1 Tax=Saguinus oedipus TaxID=9490 RepID=A0ABQ9V987_SAGOE|nr:hypothetical protein P7K49_015425 [Saguinus oedipus]